MNPLIGVTVAAYEAWNIQYATLTDKAASDFHTIPGLAESWKGSKDGLTWTYKLRPGLKWSDGKPLTAEDVAWNVNTSRDEEWINHSATTANLDATAKDDTTLVIKTKVPDPKLPTMDVYILPKHIWGKMSADARGKYAAHRRRRLRPVRARQVREGPVRPLQGEQVLLGRQAGGRRGRPAQVQQPGHDGRRSQDAARSTPPRTSPAPPSTSSRRTTNIQTIEGNQGAMSRDRDQRRRRAEEAAPGAARPRGPPGDRARDRQEDARRAGAATATARRPRR